MARSVNTRSSAIEASVGRSPEEKKYNILYILVDDVSVDMLRTYHYLSGRLGFTTSPVTVFPQMDVLGTTIAQQGVKYSNYFTMPVCSPHRVCALTGRYPTRHGTGTVVMPHYASAKYNELSDVWSTEYSIAKLLGDAGYRTLHCGKNHMSLQPSGEDPNFPIEDFPYFGSGWSHPVEKMGFTEFRGVFRNLNNQAPEPADVSGVKPGYYNFYWNELRAGAADPQGSIQQVAGTHATRYSRERLQDWILNPHRDDAGKPWFAYWALNAGHSPFGDASAASNSGVMPPDTSEYLYNPGTYPGSSTAWGGVWASMEHLDKEIGLLRAALGDMWDDTMVFFVSDNGSDQVVMQWAATDAALATRFNTYKTEVIDVADKMKGSVYSPGTRGALVVCGPLVGDKNRSSEVLIDSVDLFETFRRIGVGDASLSIPDNAVRPRDSVSFYDSLRSSAAEASSTSLRTWSFSEYFRPNGSAKAIVDTADTGFDSAGGTWNHRKERTYRKLRTGSATSGNDGHWILVRKLVGTSYVEELYQQDNYPHSTTSVDFNQTTDLSGSKPNILAELSEELDALIASMEDDDPTHITS